MTRATDVASMLPAVTDLAQTDVSALRHLVNPYEFFCSPLLLGILGLLIGSFLNVVIYRLPKMMQRELISECAAILGEEGVAVPPVDLPPEISLSLPRSTCPSCGHVIRWYENIPVVSYLVLRARCSACKTSISARYPLIEAFTGLLFAAIAYRVGPSPAALLWCGFGATLVGLSAIDRDTKILPDVMVLPLMWAGLLASVLGWTIPLFDSVVGAMAGYLSLWTVFWGFKLTTGKEGMGYGDFKLLAALGAFLGWQALLPIIIASAVVGTVVGIAMRITGALKEGDYIPFGPYLAGAGLIVMFVGVSGALALIGISL